MRPLLTTSVLAACASMALPCAALAGSVPFDVSVRGTIQEHWSADQDPVSDGCGRRTTGSGSAALSFATAKRYRLTLDSYSGFHPVVRGVGPAVCMAHMPGRVGHNAHVPGGVAAPEDEVVG